MKLTPLFIVGVSILALGSTTRAVYADGGGESLIHACLNKKGKVRIVGPDDLCKVKETPRHWTIEGLLGPQGPKGDKGDTGGTGSQGLKGNTGDQGIQGIQGVKGDDGDKGDQGIQGPKGDDGPEGPAGPGPGAVVLDDNDNVVGALVDFGRIVNDVVTGLVLRQASDIAVRFSVDREGLIDTELTLFYESRGCSGPGLLSPRSELFARGAARGTNVYYPPTSASIVSIRSNSMSPRPESACPLPPSHIPANFFTPPNICCVDIFGPDGDPQLRGPASILDLSDLTPPFHVEVQE